MVCYSNVISIDRIQAVNGLVANTVTVIDKKNG